MSKSIKLSAVALCLNIFLGSTSANAAMDVWDSSTNPWGTSTLAQYSEWNEFAWDSFSGRTYYDRTPDSGTGGVLAATGTPIITSTSNIYSWQENATQYSASLAGTTGGYFDVYLRASTFGMNPSTVAFLNGKSADSRVRTFYEVNGEQFGQVDAEHEFYYKWSNVTGADLYTFTWNDLTAHTSLDQLAIATVRVTGPITIPSPTITPVPEPESYAMILAGLGLMGLVTKRKARKV